MNTSLNTTRPKLANPWVYFAATFLWTWSFWGLAILNGSNMEVGEGIGLLLLGVAGPTITGILFTYLTRDKEGRQDFWKRVIGFNRIPAVWYLVIFLFVPAMHLIAVLLDILFGGGGSTWGELARGAAANPLSILFSIMFSTLIPFIEELGWRGYLLDRLQAKWSALASSLILGLLWSLWHLPMFFIRGSYQAGLGIGTLEFWLFFLSIVPLTFVFTWIFNNTGRSTLATILFHSMINFTGELILLSKNADTIYNLLWFAVAIAITAMWGARTFTRQQEV
jgi:membrane protease YdiL (CAAX protease family)